MRVNHVTREGFKEVLDKNRKDQGVAFADSIKTEHISLGKNKPSFREHKFRGLFLPMILLFSTSVLVIKLIDLQIIHGDYYRDISDNNRIKHEVIHAPRGVIFDRNNTPLVFNVPGFREVKNGKTILLSHEKAISLLAKNKNLEIDSLRQYPLKEEAAHVVGYIGQISKDELQMDEYVAYSAGELIGKMGLERQYEKELRGIDGRRLIEIDSHGRKIRNLGQTNPVPGKNIAVSLDAKLQTEILQSLKDVKKGAVIASTPDGQILALVSMPSFDPNLFTMDGEYKPATQSAYGTIENILTDRTNQPLLNRAISGTYPPGSTFKLVVAGVGLEKNVFDEHFVVEDTGVLQIGEFSFSNWYFTQYGKTEGSLNVVKGIARSNDVFFYKAAEKIGVDRLSENAKQFGLGERLNIDLPEEQTGLLPTTAWKEKIIGDTWYLGDTYHYGIGQGYLLTTPLQVNTWTQVIASGGSLYQPRLIKNTTNTTNTTNKPIRKEFLSEKTVSLIRQGMVESCSPGGVAWPLFKLKIKNEKLKIDGRNFLGVTEASHSGSFKDYRELVVACKTGTAEHGGKDTLPHAWITLFAPAYDPQIVVTVLVEESGEGSNVAAPIAKKILEAWFSK